MAPAVMVADEIVVEGADVPEATLEAAIRRHLGLPELAVKRRGFLERLLEK